MTTRTSGLRTFSGVSVAAVLVAALTSAAGWTQPRPSLTTGGGLSPRDGGAVELGPVGPG